MTREKAIECLSERVSIGGTGEQNCMVVFGVNTDTLDEAFDMAISALRQQEQSGKNLLRSVQAIKYTCGAGTPEEAETNCTYFIRGECTASFCEYRRKKQTNADRIRSMTDKELAEFLWDFNLADVSTVKMGEFGPHMFRYRLKDWLQHPAEEDDHGRES